MKNAITPSATTNAMPVAASVSPNEKNEGSSQLLNS